MGFLKNVTQMNGKGLLFLMRSGNPQSAVFVVQVLWGIVVLASVLTIEACSEYIAGLWLLLDLQYIYRIK
jgi:hypothetical protein